MSRLVWPWIFVSQGSQYQGVYVIALEVQRVERGGEVGSLMPQARLGANRPPRRFPFYFSSTNFLTSRCHQLMNGCLPESLQTHIHVPSLETFPPPFAAKPLISWRADSNPSPPTTFSSVVSDYQRARFWELHHAKDAPETMTCSVTSPLGVAGRA